MPDDDGSGGSVRVAFALLAEHAKVEPTNLVSIIGGGLKRLLTSSIPCPFFFSIVIQLVKDESDTFESPLEIRVVRPSGDVALSLNGELKFVEGDTINAAFAVGVVIDAEGIWSIEAHVSEASLVITNKLRVQLQAVE